MLGDMVNKIGIGVYSRAKLLGLKVFFNEILEEFKQHDFVFGNMEGVLSDEMPCNSIHTLKMRGSKEFAKQLSDIGFNVLSVANNHILEHGEKDFYETVNHLESCGIKCVGIKNKPVYINKNGLAICFIGVSVIQDFTSTDAYNRIVLGDSDFISYITKLKTTCDHIILSVHWGSEFVELPSLSQVEYARQLMEAGVSLILGHHSHCLQGYQKHGNGLVVFSLGNLISDMQFLPARKTGLFSIVLGQDSVEEVRVIPLEIGEDYILHRGYGSLGVEKNTSESSLADYDLYKNDTDYSMAVSMARKRYKVFLRKEFLCNLSKLKLWVTTQLIHYYLFNQIGLKP